ncbi:hypothetical protein PoB_002226400 [Plakobranchus ocellatus]|uniref:Uncharacterized protein n=1 Tax=Plakobranchus ocellatus TaxID=259542 RepID=A0AAV3ZKB2_9GAST|nr:hypothetical protein PoB_002226400 [Plakobranchus ocellatus]
MIAGFQALLHAGAPVAGARTRVRGVAADLRAVSLFNNDLIGAEWAPGRSYNPSYGLRIELAPLTALQMAELLNSCRFGCFFFYVKSLHNKVISGFEALLHAMAPVARARTRMRGVAADLRAVSLFNNAPVGAEWASGRSYNPSIGLRIEPPAFTA